MSDSSTVARPAVKPRRRRLMVLILLAAVAALGFLLRTPGPVSQPAPVVHVQPGLQDQVDALRLRVVVLEALADAPPRPAAAPRATAPRAGASTPAAPAPDQLAETSKFVEPPTPPAPITRQYIDQFRASLRTPQSVQE